MPAFRVLTIISSLPLFSTALTQTVFSILYPPALGDGSSSQGGCGVDPTLVVEKALPSFAVDGDAIALDVNVIEQWFLFRASLDRSGREDWLQIYPTIYIRVRGGGTGPTFCQPQFTVPQSWTGRSGVISVVGVSTLTLADYNIQVTQMAIRCIVPWL